MDIRAYNNPILMFSGGKDSLLCLLKLKGYLDVINVVWVNAVHDVIASFADRTVLCSFQCLFNTV